MEQTLCLRVLEPPGLFFIFLASLPVTFFAFASLPVSSSLLLVVSSKVNLSVAESCLCVCVCSAKYSICPLSVFVCVCVCVCAHLSTVYSVCVCVCESGSAHVCT